MKVFRISSLCTGHCANCRQEDSIRKALDRGPHGYNDSRFYLVKMRNIEFTLCRECFQTLSDLWVFDLDCGMLPPGDLYKENYER